jgi:ribose/xylose/arabinose/galactoside ABC-type transport system permease subunit
MSRSVPPANRPAQAATTGAAAEPATGPSPSHAATNDPGAVVSSPRSDPSPRSDASTGTGVPAGPQQTDPAAPSAEPSPVLRAEDGEPDDELEPPTPGALSAAVPTAATSGAPEQEPAPVGDSGPRAEDATAGSVPGEHSDAAPEPAAESATAAPGEAGAEVTEVADSASDAPSDQAPVAESSDSSAEGPGDRDAGAEGPGDRDASVEGPSDRSPDDQARGDRAPGDRARGVGPGDPVATATEPVSARDAAPDDSTVPMAAAPAPEDDDGTAGDTLVLAGTGTGTGTDEPAPVAEPDAGRDPIRVHLIWEAVLALVLTGVVVAALGFIPEVRDLDFFAGVLRTAAVIGAVAVAFSLSVRGAVPNLAVVPLFLLGAGTYFSMAGTVGPTEAVLRSVGVTAALGLLLGALTVGLRVASWAASIAVALLATGLAVAARPGAVTAEGPNLSSAGPLLFAGVAAVSVLGGLLCLIPAVRRTVGVYRGDATARTGPLASIVPVLVLVVSSAIAGAAGLLLLFTGEPAATPLTATVWLPLAAVLIGGASIHGRRVGVTGTMLGVLLLVTLHHVWQVSDLLEGPTGAGAVLALAGLAAIVGLIATPLVESAGRRAEVGSSA